MIAYGILTAKSDSANYAPFLIVGAVLLFTLILIICLVASAGKRNDEMPELKEQNPVVTEHEEHKGHPVLGAFVAILLMVGTLIAILYGVSYCSSANNGTYAGSVRPFSRKATNADITISDSKLNLGQLGQTFYFTANVDIKDLEIQFTFYDSDKQVVAEKSREMGTVVKGNQYQITFSITEFSFTENLRMSTVLIEVVSGTVSVFA